MFQKGSAVVIVDNSGIRKVRIIKRVNGSGFGPGAAFLSIVLLSFSSQYSKGSLVYCVAINSFISKFNFVFNSSFVIRTVSSAVSNHKSVGVVVTRTLDPIFTRVLFPVSKLLRSKGFVKLLLLSPFVL